MGSGVAFLSIAILAALSVVAEGRPRALFVFGDSYADNGNNNKSNPTLDTPWLPPYGQTWPGKPSGRYSDGHVLSDFVATFLKLPSPVAYQNLKSQPIQTSVGINFAFGGAGLFPTYGPDYITIPTQIGYLEKLVQSGTYSTNFLTQSVALFVVAGNDYIAYSLNYSSIEGIEPLIPMVVKEMGVFMKRLYELGFRTIALTLIEPLGCLPLYTRSNNYTTCSASHNSVSLEHNTILHKETTSLKSQLKELDIISLDLYTTFSSFLQNGASATRGLLKPCCESTIEGASCGDLNTTTGLPLFTVCNDPHRYFMWDYVHPSDKGWMLLVNKLKSSLKLLLHK